MDASRFPELARYVASLPGGLDAYPGVVAKGTLAAHLAGAFEGKTDGLPDALAELCRDPPPANAWVREVHVHALVTALADTVFKDERAGAVERWAYDVNRRLLGSALYRVLFAVMSPERLLIGMQKRWSALHRGTTFEQVEVRRGLATIRHKYPAHLLGPIALAIRRTSLRAAVETAGAKLVSVEAEEEGPTSALFHLRWR